MGDLRCPVCLRKREHTQTFASNTFLTPPKLLTLTLPHMEDGLIAGFYRIDPTRQAPTLQGGCRALAVTDRRDPSTPLIAIEAKPDQPVRPRITLARSGLPVPHAVLPVDYGPGTDLAGRPGWFAIGEMPPGAPIGLDTPWHEAELIACVLAPAAAALAALQLRGLTHRAINPDNLFRTAPREPVTLGPFWAAPPASLQPAIYEPPYMACCLPAGRGEGSIADDVYAVGVTLLALFLGRAPLKGVDEATILRRKLEVGSFAALTADTLLPPLLSDLLRGMLAEDPDHRPSPALLGRPEQARARRVAARPPRRAQIPLDLGGMRAWSARELALGLGLQPERGYALLKSGEVERWLRRHLGDPQLGMRVEDVTRRGDAPVQDDARLQNLTVMRSVAVIDPLAPLVWRGIAVQPDGIGPALAAATPDTLVALQEIVAAEAVGQFVGTGYRRQDTGPREEQREWRAWLAARGPAGGVRRLSYAMNPMLACASPLLAGHVVVRAAELLPALDAAAATADRTRPPIDSHIAAFIVSRTDATLAGDLPRLASFAGESERLAILRLFARLQARLSSGRLPGLASWLIASGLAGVSDWRSQRTRAALQDSLLQAATDGQIGRMVELLDDEPARAADRQGAEQAAARVAALQAALARITEDAPKRHASAQLLAHELVTGAGLLASLGAAVALAVN